MSELDPQFKKEMWKDRFRFFWIRFRVPVCIVEIAVPFVIDKYCGHIWGSVAAVVNIVAWLYFGIKSHVSFGLRILWLFALVYVVMVAVVEFGRLFHWSIVSSGHL
jgi:hypothetical protein